MGFIEDPKHFSNEAAMIRTIHFIKSTIPQGVKWCIDGSLSLTLQGINVTSHDIDILTDCYGAYEIEKTLTSYLVKAVTKSSSNKYESCFGKFLLYGVNVEEMGDLRVFRNGAWSEAMSPSNVVVTSIMIDGDQIPVVSIEHQWKSGYIGEKYEKGEISKEEYYKIKEGMEWRK